jgi:hypothetical protein
LTKLIIKQKFAIVVIFGLLRSKVGGKEIPLEFVAVKVQKAFMLETMVPNVNESLGLVDPKHLQMKISFGAMILSSSKFLKLI